MRRIDIAVAEAGEEPKVQVIGNKKDMRRLHFGIAAHEQTLRKLAALGIVSGQDPDIVKALSDRMTARTDIEASEGSGVEQVAELTPEQAALAHTVARAMVAQALEADLLSVALAEEIGRGRPYSWHEPPIETWKHFEEVLAPPQAHQEPA